MPNEPSYPYDLFISCAAADLKWVQGFLLPVLGLPADRVICNELSLSGAESFRAGAIIPEEFDLACRTAGRNLTERDWAQYMGNLPYLQTCPNLP
jgi:hypothetical protein